MVGEKFKESLISLSERKKSRLIFALDKIKEKERYLSEEEVLKLVELVKDYVVSVKIGHPLTMKFGIKIAKKIKQITELPVIGDFKIADIGNTNRLISELAFENGVDAVIAHAFIAKDALEPIIETARTHGEKGVFLLPTMTHPGAEVFLNKHKDEFLELAKNLDITGVIAPATRPDEIRYIREKIGEYRLILAPGVKAQGGDARKALENGADFIIVGRAIYNSPDPSEAAKNIANETWW